MGTTFHWALMGAPVAVPHLNVTSCCLDIQPTMREHRKPSAAFEVIPWTVGSSLEPSRSAPSLPLCCCFDSQGVAPTRACHVIINSERRHVDLSSIRQDGRLRKVLRMFICNIPDNHLMVYLYGSPSVQLRACKLLESRLQEQPAATVQG